MLKLIKSGIILADLLINLNTSHVKVNLEIISQLVLRE